MEVLPSIQKEYLSLKRSFALNEKFYSYLLEKKTETEMKKAVTVSQNRIIDLSLLPRTPVKPKRKLIIAVGIILGLIFGLVLSFILEFLDEKIHTIQDLEKLTYLPILGDIPHYKNANKLRQIVVSIPKSAISESFRSIRTNLQFMLQSEHKIISVTSTVAGEGKTFVSSNLAYMLSLIDEKVVIINFDLRKPTLHNVFEIKNKVGLSNYLSNRADIDDIIVKNVYENLELDIIPSGPIPPNPSELIASQLTQKLFSELSKRYDYIILDTPPIEVVTDGRLLFKYSDLTIYVLRANYSKKDFVKIPHKLKSDNAVNRIGLVLNDVKDKRNSYGYYNYY